MTNKKNTPLNSRDRRLRFSIRKFNVGVASVAVAAFFMVNGQTVAANDGTSQSPEDQSVQLVNGLDTEVIDTGTQDLQLTESSSPDLSSQKMTAVTEVKETPSESAPSSSETPDGSDDSQSNRLDEADGLAGLVPASGLADSPAPAISPEQATSNKGDELATGSPANPEGASRLAATTYKLTYTDADTQKVLYQRNYAVSEETTNRHDQPHTFRITVALELEEAPALATYRLADVQPLTIVENAVATTITEGGTDRHLNLFVTKKEAGTGTTETKEGYADFRALPGSQHETENINVGHNKTWEIHTEPTAASKKAAEDQASIENLAITETPVTAGTRSFDMKGIYGDPDKSRYTFGVVWLGDPTDGNLTDDFNERNKREYYMTFAMSSDLTTRDVYANLVDRKTNKVLESKLVKESDRNISFKALDDLTTTDKFKTQFRLHYPSGHDSLPGRMHLELQDQNAGGNNVNLYLVARLTPTSVLAQNNMMNIITPGEGTQTTSYKVVDVETYKNYLASQGTNTYLSMATGDEELLASLSQDGWEGQYFSIAGALDFDKYELIETPKVNAVEEGTLVSDVAVGSRMVTGYTNNSKRIFEVTRPDGTGKVAIYVLNPNGPRYAELAGKDQFLNTDGYVKVFETEELAPGTWSSKTGTFDYEAAGMITASKQGTIGRTVTQGDSPENGYWFTPVIHWDNNPRLRVGGLNSRMSNDRGVRRQDVTYFYVEKGSVIVHYEDSNGNRIGKRTVRLVEHGKTGDSYNTTANDLRPEVITQGNTPYYLRVTDPIKSKGLPADTIRDNKLIKHTTKETGLIEAGTNLHLTYVYEVGGRIIINYKNELGETIRPSVTDEEKVKPGTPYDTRNEGDKPQRLTGTDGKTYELSRHEGAEQGHIESGITKQVTYIYTEVTGDVDITYENTQGDVISPSVKDTTKGSLGAQYDATQGDEKPEKLTGTDGKTYFFKEHKANTAQPTGIIEEGNKTVTYVYEEAGSVLIHYKNEDGQTIQNSVIDEDQVKPGTSYDTRDEENKPTKLTGLDGQEYTFLRHEGLETGLVEAGKTKEVTYIYSQAKGTVEITYENTAGETIKPTVVDTKNGKVGERYDATQGDEKPEKLTGTDSKTYFFKEHKADTAQPTGVIASGTQTVTYIYEEAGSVLIHYKNEEGSTIKPSVLDEDKVKPGTLYNTTDEGNKPGSLTGTDKKAYTLHRHEGEESGAVISGKTIEVTYIYRPLAERSTEEDAPQPDQKATTTFIDQRGNDQTELP